MNLINSAAYMRRESSFSTNNLDDKYKEKDFSTQIPIFYQWNEGNILQKAPVMPFFKAMSAYVQLLQGAS